MQIANGEWPMTRAEQLDRQNRWLWRGKRTTVEGAQNPRFRGVEVDALDSVAPGEQLALWWVSVRSLQARQYSTNSPVEGIDSGRQSP